MSLLRYFKNKKRYQGVRRSDFVRPESTMNSFIRMDGNQSTLLGIDSFYANKRA